MKRSEINAALRELEAMAAKCGFHLPPFCHLTPEQWKSCGHEYDEVRDNMLGWDITDYGLGRFAPRLSQEPQNIAHDTISALLSWYNYKNSRVFTKKWRCSGCVL